MYAKWIHPKKIIVFSGDILRHDGKISICPTEDTLIRAGYYPVVLKEGQSLEDERNLFYEKNKEIHILREENVE